MTGCRASRGWSWGWSWGRRPFAALLAAGIAAAALSPAQAQSPRQPTGAPVQLVPRPSPEAAPTPSLPPSGPKTQEPGSADIEMTRVGPIDFGTAGLWDDAKARLPGAIWSGLGRDRLEALITGLPAPLYSPAAHDLARRLLLTSAQVPIAAASLRPPPDESGGQPPSLAARRVERLLALGDVAEAVQLAKAVGGRSEDEALAQARVDALWLTRDTATACTEVREKIDRFTSVYWQRALAFCQALAGEHARAALGMEMMPEKTDEDQTVLRLLAVLAGDRFAKVESLPRLTPLFLEMMRLADQPVPAGALAGADGSTLAAYARSPKVPVVQRLDAAERAVAAGALSPGVLRELYDEAMTSARTTRPSAKEAVGPLGRAQAYLTAKTETTSLARAGALLQLWNRGRADGRYLLAVQVGLPVLELLKPDRELAAFAGEAARAFLTLGRRAEALGWFGLTQDQVTGEGARLWPLLALAADRQGAVADPTRLAAWLEAERKRDGAAVEGRAALMGLLLTALGERNLGPLTSGEGSSGGSAAQGRMPDPALWLALRRATGERRIGETALLTITILGPEGTAGAHPIALSATIEALTTVGLTVDARALALEALLLAGL